MKRNLTICWLGVLVILYFPNMLGAQTGSGAPKPDWKDIEYATVDGHRLALDLYLPKTSIAPPELVEWVHGGKAFYDTHRNGIVRNFLNESLRH